ncbi:MAG: phosphopyruvate hydratase [Halobacteriaceae archaeon]
MTRIEAVALRTVLDSRGERTVEADVLTESGGFGRAAAPSGASTGAHEAVEREPEEAIAAAREHAVPRLRGVDAADQRAVDRTLRGADGTENLSEIGANAIVALSMAAAKAAADRLGTPLYQHLGGAFRGENWPVPLGNVVGGGEHASGGPTIQEFLVAPTGAPSVREAAFANAAVHREVRERLADRGLTVGLGDEGAWAPPLDDAAALSLVATAAEAVAERRGFEIRLGLDVAATEYYDPEDDVYVDGDSRRSPSEQLDYILELVSEHDVVYLEDPLAEDAFEAFATLTERLPERTLVCGDDLFVTNVDRIERGIELGSGSAVLIKPNQIGTFSGAVDAIELAARHGYAPVVSHRSGETEDATIAHLAVATAAPFIKTGAVGGERTAKLNELIRIEDEAL